MTNTAGHASNPPHGVPCAFLTPVRPRQSRRILHRSNQRRTLVRVIPHHQPRQRAPARRRRRQPRPADPHRQRNHHHRERAPEIHPTRHKTHRPIPFLHRNRPREHRVHGRKHRSHGAADADAAPPNRPRSAPIARRHRAHRPPHEKRPRDDPMSTDFRRQRAPGDLRGGVSVIKRRVHRSLDRLRYPRLARERRVDDGEPDAVDVTREGGGKGEAHERVARVSHGERRVVV